MRDYLGTGMGSVANKTLQCALIAYLGAWQNRTSNGHRIVTVAKPFSCSHNLSDLCRCRKPLCACHNPSLGFSFSEHLWVGSGRLCMEGPWIFNRRALGDVEGVFLLG